MMLRNMKPSSLIFYCYCSNKTILAASFRHFPGTSLFFSTAVDKDPSSETSFMVEYLIHKCGLSRDKAVKASKSVLHIKSPVTPDSVLRFFKETGLGDAHVRNLISWMPRLLCASVSQTLEPRIRAIRDLGFSGSELIRLISASKAAFYYCNLGPKIEFWRNLLGTNERLLKAIGKSNYLLGSSLSEKIIPNISLLRKCGLSDERIAGMVLNWPRIITSKLDTLKVFVDRTQELGVSPASRLFLYALNAVSSNSRATVDAKIKLFYSFGWSETECLSAIQKQPTILGYSEKKMKDVMNLLMKEVGCKPSYVALHPVLLGYSLERRLIPRCYVLRTLKLNNLPRGELDLSGAIKIPEKEFVEKFVLPQCKTVPELHETYLAACNLRTSS